MSVVDVMGWAGGAVLFLAYGLVSWGRLQGGSVAFQLLNLTGSAGLLANSAFHGAWPSAVLNGLWMVIGLAHVVAMRRRATFSAPHVG
jgi:hypothetical protein